MNSVVASIEADSAILRVGELPFECLDALLASCQLRLHLIEDGVPIPGSFWGDPEAGVIGSTVYMRNDTPLHSLLHEACHLMLLSPELRSLVHTNATDSDIEEDATCYLQIVLADKISGVGRDRLMADMDRWGYTFRLGSTRAWFEHDAEEARQWLVEHGLLAD